MAYETITLELDKYIIHKLYALAIAWDTTHDRVIEIILQKYIEEKNNRSEILDAG